MKTNNVIAMMCILLMLLQVSLVFKLQLVQTNNHFSGNVVGGNVTINIMPDITIFLLENEINFGSGTINSSCNYAILTTGNNSHPNVTTNLNSCWIGPVDNRDFIVQSLSPIPILIEMKSNKNATDFLGLPDGAFQYQTTNATGAGCSGLYVTNWTDFDKTSQQLCEGVFNNNDGASVLVKLVIPKNITYGQKNANVVFYGFQA